MIGYEEASVYIRAYQQSIMKYILRRIAEESICYTAAEESSGRVLKLGTPLITAHYRSNRD
jgi:hypothetical protein